jgi:uncharacterized protein involved in exopolysaccharide biosynthesis
MGGENAIDEAIDRLQLTGSFPHSEDGRLNDEGHRLKQEMIERFRKGTAVKWDSSSNQQGLVLVSYTDADPFLAEHMPNALIEGYIERTYRRFREELKGQHEFIKTRKENCDKGLEKMREKRIEFETSHAGQLPDNPSGLQDRIQVTLNDIEALNRRQEVAKQCLVRIHSLLQTSSAPTTQDTEVRGLNPEKKRLQDEIEKAKDELSLAMSVQHMTENHPRVKGLKTHIASLEKRMAEEPDIAVVGATVLPIEGDLRVEEIKAQSELEMVKAEIDRLTPLLQKYQDLWDNMAPARQQFLELTQQYSDLTREQDEWHKKLLEVEAALDQQIKDQGTRLTARTNSPPQYKPSSPTLPIVLGLAVVGGLLFGSGMVFVSSVLDRSITATENVAKHLNLPVCGVIAEITTEKKLRSRRLRQWTLVPVVGVVLAIALAMSALSIAIKLDDPKLYDREWRASPLTCIHDWLTLSRKGGL